LLPVHQEFHRILQGLFDRHQKADGFLSIDDPVVIGQGHEHNGGHYDAPVAYDGTLHDIVHAQNRTLGGIYDRSGQHGSEHAPIGDGEGAPGHFVHGDDPVPGPGGQAFHFGFDSPETQILRISDHRHHQPFGTGYRNTDITEIIGDHILPIDHGI